MRRIHQDSVSMVFIVVCLLLKKIPENFEHYVSGIVLVENNNFFKKQLVIK